jgi:hypothetical protein
MKIDQSPDWIKRYLFGELSEADRTAIELELLADREKFEEVCAVEDDLIDSYVRGKLSHADRTRFEIQYLASRYNRERVETARILIAGIDRIAGERVKAGERETGASWWKRIPNPLRWPQTALGGASLLALLFASGALWLYLERGRLVGQIVRIENEAQIERTSLKQREQELASRNQELEREIANERQRHEESKAALEQLRLQQSSLAPAVFSVLLPPAPVRGGKASPSLTLPRLTGRVRLLMELKGDGYASYQVRFQTVDGQEILRRPVDKVRLGEDREFAALTIRAERLTKGDYIIILFGQTADGRGQEIDRYYFRVS